MTLFRHEALDAQKNQWLGDIFLAYPLSTTFFACGALGIAAALITFLFLGDYTRKEHVAGQIALSEGLVKIYSPVTGVVKKKLVRERQSISAGQPLYVISVERNSMKGETQSAIGAQIENKCSSYRAELTTQKKVLEEQEFALRKKIANFESEFNSLQIEVGIQSRHLALNDVALTRFRNLAREKYVAAAQLEEKEQDNLDQQSRLQTLKRQMGTVRREIMAAESELKNLPLQAQNELSVIHRNIASLEEENYENEARREVTVTAMQDGRATAVLAEVGQTVTTSVPLLSEIPHNARFVAYLYVPTRAIGFMREGGVVLLRYQSFPYQKFGQHSGHILSIARAALSPGELQMSGANPENFYRVAIKLDMQQVAAYGRKFELQEGMQLEADVLLENRKLYEWVLEPLNILS